MDFQDIIFGTDYLNPLALIGCIKNIPEVFLVPAEYRNVPELVLTVKPDNINRADMGSRLSYSGNQLPKHSRPVQDLAPKGKNHGSVIAFLPTDVLRIQQRKTPSNNFN